jgi:hypothetical protein
MRGLKMKKLISALIISLAAGSAPAWAQEVGGVVMGSLDDQPLNCEIWPMQSDFSGFGNTITISITAHKCTGIEGLNQISVSFEKTGDAIGSVEIRLRGEGEALYSAPDSAIELLLANEADGFLSLAGNAFAQVGPSDDYGTSIDMSVVQPLSISFSGIIEVLGH